MSATYIGRLIQIYHTYFTHTHVHNAYKFLLTYTQHLHIYKHSNLTMHAIHTSSKYLHMQTHKYYHTIFMIHPAPAGPHTTSARRIQCEFLLRLLAGITDRVRAGPGKPSHKLAANALCLSLLVERHLFYRVGWVNGIVSRGVLLYGGLG